MRVRMDVCYFGACLYGLGTRYGSWRCARSWEFDDMGISPVGRPGIFPVDRQSSSHRDCVPLTNQTRNRKWFMENIYYYTQKYRRRTVKRVGDWVWIWFNLNALNFSRQSYDWISNIRWITVISFTVYWLFVRIILNFKLTVCFKFLKQVTKLKKIVFRPDFPSLSEIITITLICWNIFPRGRKIFLIFSNVPWGGVSEAHHWMLLCRTFRNFRIFSKLCAIYDVCSQLNSVFTFSYNR